MQAGQKSSWKSLVYATVVFRKTRTFLCSELETGAVVIEEIKQFAHKSKKRGIQDKQLTYSPQLKLGDSGVIEDCASRDGLTSSLPADDAPPA